MNRATLLALLLAFAACSPTRGASGPAPSDVTSRLPADLLPADLDFVIRIDAARLREHPLMMGLARGGDAHFREALLSGDGSGVVSLVLPELEQARSIVLGGRLTADGYRGDGVIAVDQGAGDAPRRTFATDTALSRLRATNRHVELYERASAARDEAALYVVMEDKGLVLATPAEVDSVLRVLRDGPDTGRLDPPPRGLLSFAGRFRSGGEVPVGSSAVSLRGVGLGLLRYAGSVEADDVLRVEAELVYGSEKEAANAAQAVQKVLNAVGPLGPEFGSLSDSARLAPMGPVLGLRLSVPFALMARLH